MSNLETKVKKRIGKAVRVKAEFTAHDITKKLRRIYAGTDIPHAGGVREIVHALFEIGDPVFAGYDREPDYLLGIQPPPWRYYPGFKPGIVDAVVQINKAQVPQDRRQLCPKCRNPMHKKGFGFSRVQRYRVQRYRCIPCNVQANEYTGSLFHNRKHRPVVILDALWLIAHGKTNTYTASAVEVDRGTVSTWRKVTRETWATTAPIMQSLDSRFDQGKLDKLEENLQ